MWSLSPLRTTDPQRARLPGRRGYLALDLRHGEFLGHWRAVLLPRAIPVEGGSKKERRMIENGATRCLLLESHARLREEVYSGTPHSTVPAGTGHAREQISTKES